MIDTEFKPKWIAALRSGEYPQGRSYLRTKKNEYCCLGVACDLLEVTWIDPHPSERVYVIDSGKEDYDGLSSALSTKIKNKINLQREEELHLANMNDSGSTFEEIADWIEENL